MSSLGPRFLAGPLTSLVSAGLLRVAAVAERRLRHQDATTDDGTDTRRREEQAEPEERSGEPGVVDARRVLDQAIGIALTAAALAAAPIIAARAIGAVTRRMTHRRA
jgi:hypothetical protein